LFFSSGQWNVFFFWNFLFCFWEYCPIKV
jgi:hypothetical protein